MRTLVFALCIFPFFAVSQRVSFRDATFPNGYKYSLIEFASNKSVELAINRDLEKKALPLKEDDFCVGQYGYVQKSGFIQIHQYANCISMTQSENYYYLYDLETGNEVPTSAMLNPKVETDFQNFFTKRVKDFVGAKNLNIEDKNVLNTLTIDDFSAEFTKNGIYFAAKALKGWDTKQKMFIKWTDLQSYLKISYI